MGVPRCHCDKKIYPNFPSINFTKCQCSPDLVTKSQDSFPAKCQEAPLQKVHLPKEPWIQMLLWTPMLQLAKMEKYHKRGEEVPDVAPREGEYQEYTEEQQYYQDGQQYQ